MPGILYVVATPLGNLADASPRALQTLKTVDIVACEDTRTSRGLLAAHGVSARMLALHAHNERAAGEKLLRAMRAGESVALITDAGTPAVSDPGALLVAAAHRDGIRVVPIPGPSAAIAAWSAAGFTGSFRFAGFVPSKELKELDDALPVILYEAPHRVLATVTALLARCGPEREVVICRELTKKFEEVARMKLGEAPGWLEGGAHRQQGEFVLVLGPGEAKPAADPMPVLEALLESLPASEAAKLAARITGAPRNTLYREALARAKKK